MQSFNTNTTTQAQEDKEKIVLQFINIFQAVDRAKEYLERIHSDEGSITMITKETPNYDIRILRMHADSVRNSLDLTETIRKSPTQDTQDFLDAGQKLINDLKSLTLSENDTINIWQFRRNQPQYLGLSPEEADNIIAELKKQHPDFNKEEYEAKLLGDGLTDMLRFERGCPPLHNQVLSDKYYPNHGKLECRTPEILGNTTNSSSFDAVFLAKALGASVVVSVCLLALYRNFNYVVNKSSSLLGAIKSGFTYFKSGVEHRHVSPQDEKEKRLGRTL